MAAPDAAPEAARDIHAASDAAFDETGAKRELTGLAAKIVGGVALAFSTYQLFVAAFSPLSSLVTRSLHVGFLMLLAFLIYPAGRKAARTSWATQASTSTAEAD